MIALTASHLPDAHPPWETIHLRRPTRDAVDDLHEVLIILKLRLVVSVCRHVPRTHGYMVYQMSEMLDP